METQNITSTKTPIQILEEFNSAVHYSYRSDPVFELDDNGKPTRKLAGHKTVVQANIIDLTTDRVYLRVDGSDENDALAKAIPQVPTAEKPRTAAQERTSGIIDSKDAEIAKLKADLGALRQAQPTTRRSIAASST